MYSIWAIAPEEICPRLGLGFGLELGLWRGGAFSSGTIAFVCSLCHLKLKEIKSAFLNK